MHNHLIITKVGYFQDYISMLNAMWMMQFDSNPSVSTEFINQVRYTHEILTDTATQFNYELNFPERFYPHNMSAYFWERVQLLMDEGVMFQVRTSDVIAFGAVMEQKNISSASTHSAGWSSCTKELPDGTLMVLTGGYGRKYGDLRTSVVGEF